MTFAPDKLVIATRNRGKVKEFALIFQPLGIQVQGLFDITGFTLPAVDEDQDTFLGNAAKKARITAETLGMPVLADDSGLCVDALGGEPGVYSARYAGMHATDQANNEKLLAELAQRTQPRRAQDGTIIWSAAQFRCALVMVDPHQRNSWQAEAGCDGVIIGEPRGSDGFGYDPLFYIPTLRKTFAQLEASEKSLLSHRGMAARELMKQLQREGLSD
jgi:XTP/dITP diphosphohydrolase